MLLKGGFQVPLWLSVFLLSPWFWLFCIRQGHGVTVKRWRVKPYADCGGEIRAGSGSHVKGQLSELLSACCRGYAVS